jgi:hypothetical protein
MAVWSDFIDADAVVEFEEAFFEAEQLVCRAAAKAFGVLEVGATVAVVAEVDEHGEHELAVEFEPERGVDGEVGDFTAMLFDFEEHVAFGFVLGVERDAVDGGRLGVELVRRRRRSGLDLARAAQFHGAIEFRLVLEPEDARHDRLAKLRWLTA